MDRCPSRFKLAASLAGRRLALAMAGDYLLSVSAYWPMHLSLYSSTGDPSKPGTGTALLFYGGTWAHPEPMSSRPDQSSTRRNRRSTRIALDLLQPVGSTQGILVLPGEAESGSAGVQPDEE